MRLAEVPLITEDDVQRRVAELGREIGARYGERLLTLVPVLKGGCLFASDLMRHITSPVQIEFIRARSYHGLLSTGTVEFTLLPEQNVEGLDVLVVEDILDTGCTAAAILDRLAVQRPRSLALCTFLNKPSRRMRDVRAEFVGFTIGDQFVVGYGLDYQEQYRNLSAIHVLEDC